MKKKIIDDPDGCYQFGIGCILVAIAIFILMAAAYLFT